MFSLSAGEGLTVEAPDLAFEGQERELLEYYMGRELGSLYQGVHIDGF
jgi:hypothetical protein